METMELMPGVVLRCFPDSRFKQGCLSFQLVRPMCGEEAGLNALIPSVLLRGTARHPDLRAVTLALDELYGASASALVRRVGDYQTTGFFCGFIEDRYALPGDKVLEPMLRFLEELLLQPRVCGNGFFPEIVDGEKRNLISAIESERNDKRVYATGQLLRAMCQGDSFAISRLGEREQVKAITPESAYAHYRRILRESKIELFYVGSVPAGQVKALVMPILSQIDRCYKSLPDSKPFSGAGGGQDLTERLEVAQAQLCMGFTTPITNRSPEFAAMQVCNTAFGAGMTSKLFMNVRERLSLCYSIGSSYYGSKGIMIVAAGIDADQEHSTREEILRQLEECRRGNLSQEELTAAKESLISSLRATHDSPGAIEGYYASAVLSGLDMTPENYAGAVEAVTLGQVAAAAKTLNLHTTYCLKGVEA